MMTEHIIQISISCDSKNTALILSKDLLDKKKAACIQISGPIESYFIWDEKIQKKNEWLLNIKTTSSLFSTISNLICQKHPYKIPEIIATEIKHSLPAYKDWIINQTSSL